MIHVYPGLGGTRAMYPQPWHSVPNLQRHDWPLWQGETTLAQLAQRLIELHRIQPDDHIVGSSLGGMVACEIARLIPVGSITLLGSATHPSQIHPLLRSGHPLVHVTPIRACQRAARSMRSPIARMFANSEARFIRAMVPAIFQWPGLQADVKCLRIHGSRDLCIPPSSHTTIDLLLPTGHLPAMTHPTQCIQYLQQHDIIAA